MASSRQKSCAECAKAKRRCNLKSPCLRCTQRGFTCLYAHAAQSSNPTPSTSNEGDYSTADIPIHELSSEVFDPAFPLDPILATPPDAFTDTINDMDSITWQTTIQEDNEPSKNSHKLRIEEILRSGADYRRADYHKVHTEWDKHTYEALCDPNSRYSYCLTSIKEYHREFAQDCQTPFLHPRLYTTAYAGMPENMLAAFTDCVLYAHKTPATEALVFRNMERNVDNLLQPRFADSIEEHLARTQALLVYQSIRLFEPDIRQRSLAEALMPLFEQWTDLLGDLRDVSPSISTFAGHKPSTWEEWILAESIRRTTMCCYSLITLYILLKQDRREGGGWTRAHPWTFSRHLWDAPSSFDFFNAWSEKPRFHLSCMGLDDALKEAKGDDVDSFGRMVLVTYMGLDSTKQWFRDTGGLF